MTFTILSKSSVVENKAPTLTDIDVGEIAINRHVNNPAMYIRVGTMATADASDTIIKVGPVFIGPTYPTPVAGIAPGKGEIWYDDTSNTVYFYDGGAWVPSGKGLYYQPASPASPADGDLWIDSDAPSTSLRFWNGTAWVTLITLGAATSIEDLGAIGDGNPADAPANVAAIQQAVNDAAASPLQADVVFPAGTYYIDAPIKIPQVSGKGLRITGSGADTIIKLHEDFPQSENYFDLTGSPQTITPAAFMSIMDQRNAPGAPLPQNNLIFEDFVIDGNDLELNGGNACCFLLNGIYDGSAIRSVNAITVTNFLRTAASRSFIVEHCDVNGNLAIQGIGILVAQPPTVGPILPAPEPIVTTLAPDAIPSANANLFGLAARSFNLAFQNNHFEDFDTIIRVNEAENIEIVHGRFFDANHGVVVDYDVQSWSVKHITFHDCIDAMDIGPFVALAPNQCPETGVVENCIFRGPAISTLKVHTAKDLTIYHNFFYFNSFGVLWEGLLEIVDITDPTACLQSVYVEYTDIALTVNIDELTTRPGAANSGSVINPAVAVPTVNTRTRLISDDTIYVDVAGNDGTTNPFSAATPFLTIKAALNYVYENIDLAGYQLTIQLSAGTFDTTGSQHQVHSHVIRPLVGAGAVGRYPLIIEGAGVGVTTITPQVGHTGPGIFFIDKGACVQLRNMTIENDKLGGSVLWVTNNGHLSLQDVQIRAFTLTLPYGIFVDDGGYLDWGFNGSLDVEGDFECFIHLKGAMDSVIPFGRTLNFGAATFTYSYLCLDGPGAHVVGDNIDTYTFTRGTVTGGYTGRGLAFKNNGQFNPFMVASMNKVLVAGDTPYSVGSCTPFNAGTSFDLYVDDANGDDLNHGILAGVSHAVKTIQRAVDLMALAYSWSSDANAWIRIADGVYNISSQINLRPLLGGGTMLNLVGSMITPPAAPNVEIVANYAGIATGDNNAFRNSRATTYQFWYIHIRFQGLAGNGWFGQRARAIFNRCEFTGSAGAASGVFVNHGEVECINCMWGGDMSYGVQGQVGSQLELNSGFTFRAGNNISNSFIRANEFTFVQLGVPAISGTIPGGTFAVNLTKMSMAEDTALLAGLGAGNTADASSNLL